MRADDETTAVRLRAILIAKGYSHSLSTVLMCRKVLGWTFRGSAYCQMIRQTKPSVLSEQHSYFEGPSSHTAHDTWNVPRV